MVDRVEWQCPRCERRFNIPSSAPSPSFCPDCSKAATRDDYTEDRALTLSIVGAFDIPEDIPEHHRSFEKLKTDGNARRGAQVEIDKNILTLEVAADKPPSDSLLEWRSTLLCYWILVARVKITRKTLVSTFDPPDRRAHSLEYFLRGLVPGSAMGFGGAAAIVLIGYFKTGELKVGAALAIFLICVPLSSLGYAVYSWFERPKPFAEFRFFDVDKHSISVRISLAQKSEILQQLNRAGWKVKQKTIDKPDST